MLPVSVQALLEDVLRVGVSGPGSVTGSRSQVVLSLFPGIDLLGRGFEESGFCVVRGPDLVWGGDVRRFHVPAGRFARVHGEVPGIRDGLSRQVRRSLTYSGVAWAMASQWFGSVL